MLKERNQKNIAVRRIADVEDTISIFRYALEYNWLPDEVIEELKLGGEQADADQRVSRREVRTWRVLCKQL